MSEKNEVLREMVREEFEAWHAIKFRGIELANRDEHSTFVNAWAMTAYLAQARENEKGHEIAKLQQRIHRQRVANKDLIERARRAEELERENERLREELAHYDADHICEHYYVNGVLEAECGVCGRSIHASKDKFGPAEDA